MTATYKQRMVELGVSTATKFVILVESSNGRLGDRLYNVGNEREKAIEAYNELSVALTKDALQVKRIRLINTSASEDVDRYIAVLDLTLKTEKEN
jgi:hypothetical protein